MALASAEGKFDEDESASALAEASRILESIKGSKDKEAVAETLRIVIKASGREALKLRKNQEEVDKEAEGELEKMKAAGDKYGEAVVMLALAEASSDRKGKRQTKAERWATKAQKVFKQLGKKKLEASAGIVLSKILSATSEAEAALEAASDALALAQDAGDKKLEALALDCEAVANAGLKVYDEALQKEDAAVALVKGLGLKYLEAAAKCKMSGWYAESGKAKKAVVVAEDALAVHPSNLSTLALVMALKANSQAKDAVKAAKEGLERERKAGDKREEMVALTIVSKAYFAGGDAAGALNSALSALELAKELGDKKTQCNLLHEAATAHLETRRYESAVQPLKDAAILAEDLGAMTQKAVTLRMLSQLHVDMQKYDKALEFSSEAQAVFHDEGDKRGEASALMIDSGAHGVAGDTQKAITAALKAYELYFVAGDSKREAMTEQTIADLYLSLNKPDEAMDMLEKSLRAFQDMGDKAGEAGTLQRIAFLYMSCGQIPPAEGYAQAALATSQEAKDVATEAQALVLLSNIYLKAYEAEDHSGDSHLTSPALEKLKGYTSQASALANQTSDVQLQGTAALNRAFYLYCSQRPAPEEAMTAAQKAQGLFRSAAMATGEAQALVCSAYLYVQKEDLDQARQCIMQASSLYNSAGDTAGEAEARETLNYLDQAASFGAAGGDVGRPVGRRGGAPDAGAVSGAGETGLAKTGLDASMVRARLFDMARNVMGTDDDLSGDSPLMDAGMDSLSSIDFTNNVAREWKLGTSPSLVFDYPSLREIVDHLVEESKGN